MSFKEIIGNVTNWIKKAIQVVWAVFKVIVKAVLKLLKSFLLTIGEFIRDVYTDLRARLKKIFVVKTPKGDLLSMINKAKEEGKAGVYKTSPDELFGESSTKSAEYDYNIVITDNGITNVEKIETISAEEVDRKIEERFHDEVTEMTI